MKRTIKLSPREYYTRHFKIVAACFNISVNEMSLKVLVEFLLLPEEITAQEMFNPTSRKIVRDNLNISFSGLSNYIGSLIDVHILQKDELTKRIKINPFILPNKSEQTYEFKLLNNVDTK